MSLKRPSTKAELIAKYGQEWYDALKERQREKAKNKKLSPEELEKKREAARKWNAEHKQICIERATKWNKEHREQCSEAVKASLSKNPNYRTNWYRKKFVKDGRFDLVEDYDKAKANNFNGWVLHHLKGEILDREDLIKQNMYFDRPPEEFKWVTKAEHNRIHKLIITEEEMNQEIDENVDWF